MSIPATESAIDIAYWFFERSEQDKLFLEDARLQHLLFLSQVNFAQKYNGEVLMPSLFICTDDGFIEPTLNKIFSNGRPFMPLPKLDVKVSNFLEDIWQKYAKMPLESFSHLIKNSSAYRDSFQPGEKIIVELKDVLEKFKAANTNMEDTRKKMLISQNGPVLVSKWQPRKVSTHTLEGI